MLPTPSQSVHQLNKVFSHMSKQIINQLIQCATDILEEVLIASIPMQRAIAKNKPFSRLRSRERRFLKNVLYQTCREWFADDQNLNQLNRKQRLRKRLIATWMRHTHFSNQLSFDAPPKMPPIDAERFAFPTTWRSEISPSISSEALTLTGGFFEEAQTDFCTDSSEILHEYFQEHDIASSAIVELPFAVNAERNVSREMLDNFRKQNQSVWPMDRGSQMIVQALDVNSKHDVLDLCAGGAGKSRLIQLYQPNTLTSVDIEKSRLVDIPKTSNTHIIIADSQTHQFEQKYDRILVDVPCTGSGTLRRHPDLMLRLETETISQFHKIQENILINGLAHLKPGGLLIYATCSIFARENETLIERVLAQLNSAEYISKGGQYLLPETHQSDGFFHHTFHRAL